ncbi:hypothetical protein PISMIDRAFT_12160 [Pisolithus microcarpus 441]|uniref:Unplaced genomic scaffold scaffold_65, whole genome shotgun sequence n=1 Tax=Pisolithus microcarpus 441 TaxID=765257 RepID=A0A0C9YY04_9AGAM|nr:hypothetical protein BKA83DRAFT_12160 [Pisolithus microcarpus]KIK21666.1 hypothetical protein PISMIDRAFT_12160 [Pisolithus microcarpus 441]
MAILFHLQRTCPTAGLTSNDDDPSHFESLSVRIPSRYGEIKPPGCSWYGSLGTIGRLPLGGSSHPFDSSSSNGNNGNGYRHNTINASNMSPFDENGSGGSGHDTQDESAAGVHSCIFHAPSFGHGGFVLSDNDLAADLGSLSLSKDRSGPSSSAHPPNQPSSLPIYAPVLRSPLSSDQISPYQRINLNIPTGTSFASHQRFGSPSDSGLSAGDSPPHSQLEQQLIDTQYLTGGNNDHGSQQQHQGRFEVLVFPDNYVK